MLEWDAVLESVQVSALASGAELASVPALKSVLAAAWRKARHEGTMLLLMALAPASLEAAKGARRLETVPQNYQNSDFPLIETTRFYCLFWRWRLQCFGNPVGK